LWTKLGFTSFFSPVQARGCRKRPRRTSTVQTSTPSDTRAHDSLSTPLPPILVLHTQLVFGDAPWVLVLLRNECFCPHRFFHRHLCVPILTCQGVTPGWRWLGARRSRVCRRSHFPSSFFSARVFFYLLLKIAFWPTEGPLPASFSHFSKISPPPSPLLNISAQPTVRSGPLRAGYSFASSEPFCPQRQFAMSSISIPSGSPTPPDLGIPASFPPNSPRCSTTRFWSLPPRLPLSGFGRPRFESLFRAILLKVVHRWPAVKFNPPPHLCTACHLAETTFGEIPPSHPCF